MRTSWLNPSGGLFYHWRALHHARGDWAPFRLSLAQWLEPRLAKAAQTGDGTLLLFGPSGGYSLRENGLRHFKKLFLFDPDPLARFVFELSLGKKLRAQGTELFWSGADHLHPERLPALLESHPGSTILFSNLLGQLTLLDEQRWEKLKEHLPRILEKRTWLSYHDRLSGPAQPKLNAGLPSTSERSLSDSELLARFYSGSVGELTDHATGTLAPELPRAYFSWKLDRHSWHLVEGICSQDLNLDLSSMP